MVLCIGREIVPFVIVMSIMTVTLALAMVISRNGRVRLSNCWGAGQRNAYYWYVVVS